jgi:hypothetical protein
LNQSSSHWLLSNALQSPITLRLKFKEEITNPSTLINSTDDDYGIAFELSLFVSNIRRKVCGVLDFFFHFEENLKKEKSQHVLFDTKP